MVSTLNDLRGKDKELLKKYLGELKKFNEELLEFMPKIVEAGHSYDADRISETNILKYRPKIMRALASVEQLYPDIEDIEYIEDLKLSFETISGKYDEEDYHEIVSALGGIVGALEMRLRKLNP